MKKQALETVIYNYFLHKKFILKFYLWKYLHYFKNLSCAESHVLYFNT